MWWRDFSFSALAATLLFSKTAAGLLTGNTGPCSRSDSIQYLTWIQKHKPAGVEGTWVDPFSTEAWWNSNNGNGKRKREQTLAPSHLGPRNQARGISKRQLDCSDSDTPGVCLRDRGRLLCYSQSSGVGMYDDGYELNFVTGDYTTPDGDKGNIQYGPCPGAVYDKEDDGRRCTRNPTPSKTTETTTGDSVLRTDEPDNSDGTGASEPTATEDSRAAAASSPDRIVVFLGISGFLWLF